MQELAKFNRQPNKITYSRQRFSLMEKRIVFLVINKLDAKIDVNYDLFENKVIEISAKELNLGKNYDLLRINGISLAKRLISFIDDEKQGFDFITPFPRIRYTNGKLFVTVLADVIPHFLDLKKGYTQYELAAALQLTHTYSQRMYELLSRWKDTGHWVNIDIENELKPLLGVKPELYVKHASFMKRVIGVAQKELAEKTDLSFKCVRNKTGAKYTHIDFYIYWDKNKFKTERAAEKEAIKAFSFDALTDKQKRLLKHLQSISVVDAKLQAEIMQNKESDFWRWWLFYQENKNKISSPAGHLIKTLGLIKKSK